MEENVRIPEAELPSNFVDGEVVGHTDLNKIISILKAGVNANYEDILDIIEGIITVENAVKLDGASLAKSSELTIGTDDAKVPTNGLVYTYLQTIINELNQRIDSMSGSSSSGESYTIELQETDSEAVIEAPAEVVSVLEEIKAKYETDKVLPDTNIFWNFNGSYTVHLKMNDVVLNDESVFMLNAGSMFVDSGYSNPFIITFVNLGEGFWQIHFLR